MERKLSDGQWIEVEADREAEFIDMVLEREPWYAPRVNREPMTTREQVIAFLDSGQEINFDGDWYAKLRTVKPAPPAPIEMVRCPNCLTSVPKGQLMSSSRGTACPHCYDEMSD